MKKDLYSPPALTDLIRALSAWRILLLAGLAGALLGALVFRVLPPPYRAATRVMVDHNLEQIMLPEAIDKDEFYYLQRETQKIEELIWSDKVLERVSARVGFASPGDLRSGKLYLSQPYDGGWSLYGVDADPDRARELAVAWAHSFLEEGAVVLPAARELVAVRKELDEMTNNLDPASIARRGQLEKRQNDLEAVSQGINPFIQLSISQQDAIPVERVSRLGSYLFSGSVSGLFLALLGMLLFGRAEGHGRDE